MKYFIKKTLRILKTSFTLACQTLSFVFLILAYLLSKLFNFAKKFIPQKIASKLEKPFSKIWNFTLNKLDKNRTNSISRIDLIELSLQNLQVKRTRTLVTVGGISLGIAAIVLLVSLGFGLQNVVVSRVARLEEMKQAEVSPPSGGSLLINDESLSKFKNLSQVESALPLISVVGRVTYQEAISDMAVYGVTTDYLKQSAIKPVKGKIFENNNLSLKISKTDPKDFIDGKVAGLSTQSGEFSQRIQPVEFNLEPNTWLKIREKPSTNSKVLGYTQRVEGKLSGYQVWGDSYQYQNLKSSKWLESEFLTWQSIDSGYRPEKKDNQAQAQTKGYVAQINVQLAPLPQGQVLGESTQSEIDWIDLATESAQQEDKILTVDFNPDESYQAVVNQAVLKILDIPENQAIGKTFQVSFVAMGQSIGEDDKKAQSSPVDYEIVGVIPGDRTPLFYVPFVNLRQLGVVNYDQAKIVVSNQDNLPQTRQQLEAMGFITRSVTDTVRQIKGLFSTARTVLALLGMTALIVASLGMFNTLTVSLLERTREVGLMKALGMKSQEIKELFLTESMIMGLFGGLIGIFLGFVVGKILSLLVSILAIFKGVGFINLTIIPLGFMVLIVFLSLVVGVVTGLYPARRATKISALNALRYE